MKFTIIRFEQFTSSAGKPYARVTLKNEAGTTFENVTIFGSHPGYIDLKEGAVVEGELTPNDYNGKKGWKMQALTSAPKWSTKGPSGAVKAAETTAKSVERSQDRKDTSIKTSSTFRDATILTAEWMKKSQVPFLSDEDMKNKWVELRTWLWENYDVDEPPF